MARHSRSTAAFRVSVAALSLLAMLAPVSAALAAPKTDVVYFTNGDRLTGEIKGMEKGKLELSTSTAGTVQIEWDKIERVETGQYLHVETTDGAHYFGKAAADGQGGTMRLDVQGRPEGQPLAMASIVRVDPIDQGRVLERLDGYLTVGFNYAKADNRTQFNLSGGISSRNERREWSLDGMTTVNADSGNDSSGMYDVTLEGRRFLGNRWFLGAFGTLQGNEELGLQLREVAGGVAGRYFLQDSHREWFVAAGLAFARENFSNEPIRNSLEAVLATSYSFFQYDTPKRSLDFGVAVFPSLTESGRVRAEADLDSRFEIVEDLFFDVTLYGSYDNKANEHAASNSDYGVVTSLGYSF